MSKKSEYQYEPADESFLVNDDPSLTPIRISLPSPPPLHLIDGYGLPPREQRFKRQQVPKKLQSLYQDVKEGLENFATGRSSYKVTLYKVQVAFWNRLKNAQEVYKDEIEWLKKIWWHRVHGYWFFNNGKPTYICGWHFMYVNFWQYTETKKSGDKFPEYRDRDRRWFLFNWYAYTCTETFKEIDRDGKAIKKGDIYEMQDIGRRLSYGTGNTKQRRAGETHKSLCIGHEMMTINEGGTAGIISYNNKNSEQHFREKLVPAWQRFPMFFMPYYDGSYAPSNNVRYRVPGTEVGNVGVNSVMNYAESGDGKSYDGSRLIFILTDEEGKTTEYSVSARWDVLKECLSTGNGMQIHGLSIHPSTVEDINGDGAKSYKELANQSNFYIRNEATGRTTSGLFWQFYPAYDGLEGFVDSYGYSVIGDLKPWQKEEGFRIGADVYLKKERQQLLASGRPEDIDRYRSLCRKFPIQYADSWIGDYGGIGWDVLKIDAALSELDRNRDRLPRRGNFIGNPEEGVRFEDDPEGRWYLSQTLSPKDANRKQRKSIVDMVTGNYKLVYEPENKLKYTAGADPYKYAKKAQMKTTKMSGYSQGGGCVFWHRDTRIDPDSKLIESWESNRFVCTYLHRPLDPDEYGEDMIKMCVYFGAMMYPETNVDSLWRYFEKRGFDGYLKYDVDDKGRFKDRPGIYSMESNKQDMFGLMQKHIKDHVLRERHPDLLTQMKDIAAIDDMTNFDLLTAALLALWGSGQRVNDLLDELDDGIDLGVMTDIF